MVSNPHPSSPPEAAQQDMAAGFLSFIDRALRGRENKTILNTSVGLSSLEFGYQQFEELDQVTPSLLATNNMKLFSTPDLATHPLFDFNSDNFTLFGLDFPDVFQQLSGGIPEHHSPLYEETLATKIGLPDLPYGELAHFMHMGMALYDSGRTFQDLWNEPELHHNVFKIVTHPDFAHSTLSWGVMLTVMGLLHPLGTFVAIGTGYLCMHLVHSFFGLMEDNKDAIRQIENVPVLKHIYDATGIKEWAEREKTEPKSSDSPTDPYGDVLTQRPRVALSQADHAGRLEEAIRQARVAAA